MKSAIFQEQKGPLALRNIRKQNVRKRPKTLSPLVASPVTPSLLKWNLEDMIASYTANGSLPTPLSPTLPPRFKTETANDEEDADAEADDTNDSDIDNMPMSLLSPTLPGIFDQKLESATPLAHPLPKKPSTVSSVLNTSSKGTVRWFNKLNDEKRRFLLRITFKTQLKKYKHTFRNKPPAKLHGLGIFEGKKDTDIATSAATGSPVRNSRPSWHKIARDIQLHNDKLTAKDSLFSIILQLDWLLALAIAYDTDEKQNVKASHSRNWMHLHAEIPTLVLRIEKYVKSLNVGDRKKSYLSFIVGVLAIMKALLLKRVNAIHSGTISGLKDPTSEQKSKIFDLQAQMIANYSLMEEHLAESQSFFSNSPPALTVFPKSSHNRAPSIPRPLELPLTPASDPYFLPLGTYSHLPEVCAYLHCCLREFFEAVGLETDGGAKYSLQSGNRRVQT